MTTIDRETREAIHKAVKESAVDPERFLPGRLLRALEETERELAMYRLDGATFSLLRRANEKRHVERWKGDGVKEVTLEFRGNELAGEVGEACNVIKKLARARLGIMGSRSSVADLADELADVIICADLIAMDLGFDLGAAVAAKFNKTSEKLNLVTRMR